MTILGRPQNRAQYSICTGPVQHLYCRSDRGRSGLVAPVPVWGDAARDKPNLTDV